jgi:hypothetical protein
MAAIDAKTHSRPVAIAPRPAKASSTDLGATGDSPQRTMPYTCRTCAKRKVKCDKTPICFSSRQSKLECFYQALGPPRRQKRKLSGDVNERLARYESILNQHGLLPKDADISHSIEETPQEPISLLWNEPETSRKGRLLTDQGKSRYIDSTLWRNLGDDEMQSMSDDEEEDRVGTSAAWDFASDPLTGTFMGSQQSLLQYHPTYAKAIMLWKTYTENVEPICKVLHIPSTLKMVEMVSKQPEMASKADECLLFAIYHFAVFSVTEEDCAKKFGRSRAS